MGSTSHDASRFQESVASRLIRAYCENAGISILELAERSGVSPSTLRKIERGELPIDFEDLAAACNALHVNVLEFVDRAMLLSTHTIVRHGPKCHREKARCSSR